MQSNNPVLARMEADAKRNGGYAGFGTATRTSPAPGGAPPAPPGYGVPASTAPQPVAMPGRVMALPDVIAKTLILFAVMLPVAVVAWVVDVPFGVFFVAMFAALGVGLWATAKRVPSPPLFLLYAALEGIVLGGISKLYNQWAIDNGAEQGIVGTAIVGTLVVFVLMLLLYGTRIIKVSGNIAKMFTIAVVSYLILSVGSLVLGMFGVGGGFGIFGLGWLGVAFSMLAVALASFSLVMDFAMIEQMIKAGAPENESWRAGFALVVSLVWLYLELLRMLALLSGNRN